jgi:cytoplasmic FMR1 interacting protein
MSGIEDIDQKIGSKDHALNYREWYNEACVLRESSDVPLFHTFLYKLEESLSQVHLGQHSPGEALKDPKAFYRIWTALQFIACVPSVAGDRRIRELFGDGFFWSG